MVSPAASLASACHKSAAALTSRLAEATARNLPTGRGNSEAAARREGRNKDRVVRRRRARALRQVAQEEIDLHLRPLGALVAAVFGLQVVWHLWAGRKSTMVINAICLGVTALVVVQPWTWAGPRELHLWQVEACMVFIVVVGAMCQDAHSCGIFDLWVLALGGGVLGVAVRGMRYHMLIHAIVAVWVVVRTAEEGWGWGLWRGFQRMGIVANVSSEYPRSQAVIAAMRSASPSMRGQLDDIDDDVLLSAATRHLGTWWALTALTVRLLAVLLATVASRLFADRIARERAVCMAVDALADNDAEEVERLSQELPPGVRFSLMTCLARIAEAARDAPPSSSSNAESSARGSAVWPLTPQVARPEGSQPQSPASWWLPLTSRSLPNMDPPTPASRDLPGRCATPPPGVGGGRRRARSAPPLNSERSADPSLAAEPCLPAAQEAAEPAAAPASDASPAVDDNEPPRLCCPAAEGSPPLDSPGSGRRSGGGSDPSPDREPELAAQPPPLRNAPPTISDGSSSPATRGDCTAPPAPTPVSADFRGPHRPLLALSPPAQPLQQPAVPQPTAPPAPQPLLQFAPGPTVEGQGAEQHGAPAAPLLPFGFPSPCAYWPPPYPLLHAWASAAGSLPGGCCGPLGGGLFLAAGCQGGHPGAAQGQQPTAKPPSAAAQTQRRGPEPPCEHNDWDSTRSKRGWHMLRCRQCLAQWRVFTKKASENGSMRAFCTAFRSPDGCPLGARCPMPHVHRYKTAAEGPAESTVADDASE